MSSSPVYLSHARYGKQAIRVFRVVREDKWHTVVEYNVTVLLEGDIDVSYVLNSGVRMRQALITFVRTDTRRPITRL